MKLDCFWLRLYSTGGAPVKGPQLTVRYPTPCSLWEWELLSVLPNDRKINGEHSTTSKGKARVPANPSVSQSNFDMLKAKLLETQDCAGLRMPGRPLVTPTLTNTIALALGAIVLTLVTQPEYPG